MYVRLYRRVQRADAHLTQEVHRARVVKVLLVQAPERRASKVFIASDTSYS